MSDLPPVISVTELTRSYPSGARVGPLTFSIPRGGITGLVGPNGVGKTTTIRMLLGLIAPSGGSLQVLDATSWAELPTVLDRVGALVDGPALISTLSGRKNLVALTTMAGWPQSRATEVLEIVGLTERADRRVKEYSLGMRQRLALAAALLGHPELIIVDEPANGLDPQGVAELRALLSRIVANGTTVVVSSHVLSEVEQVCDHLVVMSSDGVAFHGPRLELASRLSSSLVVELADDDQVMLTQQQRVRALCDLLNEAGLQAEAQAETPTETQDLGRVVVSAAAPTEGGPRQAPDGGLVNGLAAQAGLVLSRIERHEQSLEDIFFDLTGAPGSTAERLGQLPGRQDQSR